MGPTEKLTEPQKENLVCPHLFWSHNHYYCIHLFWKSKRGVSIGTGSYLINNDEPPIKAPRVCPKVPQETFCTPSHSTGVKRWSIGSRNNEG